MPDNNDERVEERFAHTSPTFTADGDLGPQELTALFLRIAFASSRRLTILYAKAGGFTGDFVDERNYAEFMKCLTADVRSLKPADMKNAEKWFIAEIQKAITEHVWETLFSDAPTEVSISDRKLVLKAHRYIKITNFPRDFEFNKQVLLNRAIEKAMENKNGDLQFCRLKLDQNKYRLIPLFRQALNRGINKYGEQDYEQFLGEVTDFFHYFIGPGKFQFYTYLPPITELGIYILQWLEHQSATLSDVNSGIDFEYWCAKEIEKQGWRAQVSKASGDQGVDILASYGDYSVAIQCKFYTQPTSNKSVQEVFAGKRFYSAHAAAVISTGGYTQSARELASSTNVLLFDASEIHFLTERFKSVLNLAK